MASRGGNVGLLVLQLEGLAKERGMLPGQATLFWQPAQNPQTPARIDVYVGSKQVTLMDRHDFLPKFPPGMRKGDVEFTIAALVAVFRAMP